MTFAEAMDAVGVSAVDLAETFGLQPQTIRQMRLDPSSASYREPPNNWRLLLAGYARERCTELTALAEQLEREAAA